MTADDANLEMILAVFSMRWKAKHALEGLREGSEEGSFELIDGAIMVKGSDGNLSIDETLGPTATKGAKRGAVIGGIIGVIFPPGLVAAAAVGAAAGATAGHLRKLGLSEAYMEELNEEMAAGRTALMVVVAESDAEAVAGEIDDYIRIDRRPVKQAD
jgi:uncharacterized membrane protein